MTHTLRLFYRHPNAGYFSLEKLFEAIGRQISLTYSNEFRVEEIHMPYTSNWGKVPANTRFARRHQAAINHVTGDIHYAILGFGKKKINVLTVHDCVMLHRLREGSLKHKVMKWLWYDLPVKRADAVTVISENTRKELLHFTNCDPSKIRVIPDFVDPAFQPSPHHFRKELPRILFIGSTPNKNLQRLVMALEGMKVQLEIVGSPNEKELRLLKEYRIDYHQSSGLTPEALLEKYLQCDMLAFPSTYEGFGLPIVEAQAVGRPVLTSDLPPMNWVSGDGACRVDPYDIISIRNGILAILDNADRRQQLIEAGFKNVARFRLDSVTDQYVSLYRELVQQKLK
jgi:glycosyltransferase involved in cell wall biosynthesis